MNNECTQSLTVLEVLLTCMRTVKKATKNVIRHAHARGISNMKMLSTMHVCTKLSIAKCYSLKTLINVTNLVITIMLYTLQSSQ